MIARLTALALVGAALLTPGVAMTQEGKVAGFYVTGEQLNDACRIYLSVRRNNGQANSTQEAWSAGMCYGYVVGVMDLYSGLKVSYNAISGDPQPAFCTGMINGLSAAEAVALYLDQHPEERSEVGFYLVRKILAEKFPC
ncbi:MULTISPECIES: Rap1a/Tai family immunity protein [unclassified Mesorhizobium]|uniref:Rap1a/Tai family immunity protein n=1 Tax=unclassified Mesorhizobium TaxID=325217 RepID=UPI001FE430C7|nr:MULTISPECIES: Rap1a/Tai family immunity protein [unclassified Mesorhizobium]